MSIVHYAAQEATPMAPASAVSTAIITLSSLPHRAHNRLDDYEPYFVKWTAEEMANIGYTLCCQIDVMMNGYLATLEERFRTEGGMKERMYRVRTGYRAEQDRQMREMEATIKWQAERIKELEAELKRMRGE